MHQIKTLVLSLFLLALFQSCGSTPDVKPPVAKKIPKELKIHEHTRIDNYYWLNQRENQDVIDYLTAENNYTKSMLSHTEAFQEKLFEEMKSRIKKDDQSVPYKKNGYFYITRHEEDNDYPVYSRKKGSLHADEEIMLNVNEMVGTHSYYAINSLHVSEDNKILGFALDTVSRRNYTLKFKNLETGTILSDEIPMTSGSYTWANDNKTIFYAVKDPQTLRSYKIMKHVLGTDVATDEVIFEEKDTQYRVYLYKTKSSKYIVLGSRMTESSELWVLDADKPNGTFKRVAPREQGFEYSISHHKNDFYILTNLNAKNFRLMKTDVNTTNRENWQEVIPHREDVLLEDIELFEHFLVLEERKEGLLQLRIINRKNNSEHYLQFGEDAYRARKSTNLDFKTEILRFDYTSFTTPYSLFDYNMQTKTKTLLKQQEVVGGYNSENYQAERFYAKAQDGTNIPVSLVYKKSLKKETNPLLLYGYGSYGSSRDVYFSSTRLSLLDRGFIYVIAHIRGGQELGKDWYENGKLLNKKNTFTDFIDCGNFLIEKGYTTKENLFAMGGSAGGLLMGAVINMAPEMFKGVIASVPFVDVVTTMLDESIPLTTFEYKEWGNPNNKEYYEYILSYSPYDNVEAKNYPNLLVTTGLHDSQVQYWEPAKWVAKLREMKTGNNILLLDTDMEAGHGGTTGRFKSLKQAAKNYAFLLDQAGKMH